MKYLPILLMLFASFACNHGQEEEKTIIPVGKIETPQGTMLFYFHDSVPMHQESFLKLAKEQYWDTLSFNRVINNFVIQGGCPDTPEGFSDSPYLIDPEFPKAARHIYGAVGAGRDENPEMRSAGCQFYIVHNSDGLARLDDKYTIFGQLFKGFDVLNAIATSPTDSLDQPLSRIPLKISYIEMTEEAFEKSKSKE